MPPAYASAARAVAAASLFQACLRVCMCTCCGMRGKLANSRGGVGKTMYRNYSTRTATARPKQLALPINLQIQRAHEQGYICLFVCFVAIFLGETLWRFQLPHTGQPEKLRLSVSVLLCNFERSAILLKNFHLHLCRGTLAAWTWCWREDAYPEPGLCYLIQIETETFFLYSEKTQ